MGGGGEGHVTPKSQKLAQTVKENGIKLVGYTLRLKNYVKILTTSVRFLRADAATAAR